MKLTGKTAVVTGSSRGIGRAIAEKLARDGARIVVHFKDNEKAAQQVVQEIEDANGQALALGADFSDVMEVRRFFSAVETHFGALDILVNNAGWAKFGNLDEVGEDDFDEVFDLNVRGLFFATQEAAKMMRDNGRIVNISSGITRANAAGGAVYAGSKAAVEAFTRCFTAELGGRGITVNTVSPGMTETDLVREVMSEEALNAAAQRSPFGRIGQPQDIADVVAFLCSDDARWLTAQNILANGGVE